MALNKGQKWLADESERNTIKHLADVEKYMTSIDAAYQQIFNDFAKEVKSLLKVIESLNLTEAEKVKYLLQLDRYKRLMIQMDGNLKELNSEVSTNLKELFRGYFEETVENQSKALAEVLGKEIDMSKFSFLDTSSIDMAITYNWQHYDFETALNQTSRLGDSVNKAIANGIAKGSSIPKIMKELMETAGLASFYAKRIARTETARIINDATKKTYQEMEVDRVQWNDAPELNRNAPCPVCRARNGKVYKLGDEPSLPAHPHCRCCLVAYSVKGEKL
ncbi:hypothetical protein CON64_18475 [Bacillus pseudomycoides]|nr:hypothetical protein CON64_18475 [Bacillus pseudomycoides]